MTISLDTLDKILTKPVTTKPIAKFLIQVNTIYRPRHTDVLGSFNVWRKGGWFGTGEDLLRFCAADGCLGIFDYSFALNEREAALVEGKDIPDWPFELYTKYANWYDLPTTCRKCGSVAPRHALADSYGFNMSYARIASRMGDIFEILERNADIYMVRTKEDKLFQKAQAELHGVKPSMDKYRELLEKGRDRDSVFYSMDSIGKDAPLASVENRFLALLKA